MAEETILLLGVALAFVFGWNNSSFLIGSGKGSGSPAIAMLPSSSRTRRREPITAISMIASRQK